MVNYKFMVILLVPWLFLKVLFQHCLFSLVYIVWLMQVCYVDCREGARVVWSYVDRILGQPSLIRESSRGKYPWSGFFSRAMSTLKGANGGSAKSENGFGDVILHPSLEKRIQQLANATANTKSHQAPFRNMLFYGPPGTGKTMVARELARRSVRSFFLFQLMSRDLYLFILICVSCKIVKYCIWVREAC